MELIDIVDENGNYTGKYIDRMSVHEQKLLHWEVIIFVVNKKGEVLLQKRSANKRFFPNKWALCSGLVIHGESIVDGALRELKEEIGVEFSKDEIKVLEENINLTRFYYVICEKEENEFIIQEEELSCVKWFDIKEVIDLIKKHDESLVIKESRIFLLERLLKILSK